MSGQFPTRQRNHMTPYAANTSVPVDRSKAEIESTITRYGAKSFASGWKDGEAVVSFEINTRRVLFRLPLPAKEDEAFNKTPGGRTRKAPAAAYAAWEQACRQKWRALGLAIKAKLEAVQSGIAVFDEEFMAYIVVGDGRTVSDHLLKDFDKICHTGKLPPLLPGPKGT